MVSVEKVVIKYKCDICEKDFDDEIECLKHEKTCCYCKIHKQYMLHSEDKRDDHYRQTYIDFENARIVKNEYFYNGFGKSEKIREKDKYTKIISIKCCPFCGRGIKNK